MSVIRQLRDASLEFTPRVGRWPVLAFVIFFLYQVCIGYRLDYLVPLIVVKGELTRCDRDGAIIRANQRIGICRIWGDDTGDTIGAFVFDGSDEIDREDRARSADWERASIILGKNTPFNAMGRMLFTHRHIYGHLYQVKFSI